MLCPHGSFVSARFHNNEPVWSNVYALDPCKEDINPYHIQKWYVIKNWFIIKKVV